MSQPNEPFTDKPSNEAAEWVAPLEQEQRNARPADLVWPLLPKQKKLPAQGESEQNQSDPTERLPRPVRTGWFTGLLIVALLAYGYFGPKNPTHGAAHFFYMTLSMVYFQLTVTWLALGNWPASLRLIAIFGLSAACLGVDYFVQDSVGWAKNLQDTILGTLLICIFAIPLGLLKFVGFRLARLRVPVDALTGLPVTGETYPFTTTSLERGSQFTIRQMLDWTTTVALFVVLVRYTVTHFDEKALRLFDNARTLIIMGGIFSLILFLAIRAIFHYPLVAARWMLPIVTLQIAIIVLLKLAGRGRMLPESTIFCQVPLIQVMLIFCFYRFAGYRLIRVRRGSPTIEEGANVATG